MEHIKLSIIIVSYNTCKVLDECLSSIYGAKWTSSYEVIIVDNNSSDGSLEMIRTKYSQAKIIANADNKLFAIANNQGAKIAKGEYLLLLNSDTIVWGDNIQKMVDFFDTLSHDIICIGPRVLNNDKSLQSCGFPNGGYRERLTLCLKLHKIFPPHFVELLFGIKGLPQDTNNVREVGWVAGCCMMIRRGLYEKVGGLNENLEFYAEEPEFGYRTSRMGYKTLYYPLSEIIHLGGISTKKDKKEHEKEVIRFRRYTKAQELTVGYTKAIRMSEIVVAIAYIRKLFSKNKSQWSDSIAYEKRLIKHLKNKRKEKQTIL